jgi:uroporphyrinogen III methyltransferase/synthase
MSDRPAGRIYLVGGGPGDPGLLTLRGRECLQRADVVLYDYLVNPRVLDHAPQAELVCLGRHRYDRVMDQSEINTRLVELALGGRVVVRLKGGDPAVFGHLAEEVEALRAANVEYEIVPGVTAASAAASYAGIPLTWRDAASAVAFITGQEGHDKQSQLDFGALARFPGTLVFYMGVTTVQHWTAGLIAAGMPPDTPAACVLRASWPDQQTLLSTLGQMAERIEQQRVRPPAIFIVGRVAGLSGTIDWFSRRPLAGVTVLATRPLRPADLMADPLAEQLAELGANVLRQPAIEIGDPPDWQLVDAAIAALARFDWVVFSSANGVDAFLGRLLAGGRDLRALGAVRLAAIGPGTADALARYHLLADVVPGEYRAEALAAALANRARGQRFLLVRASRGRQILAEQLRAAGGSVDEVVAYTSRDVSEPDAQIAERLKSGRIDWITVTSSAIARSLAAMFGQGLCSAKLASISPITSSVLREAGFEPTVEASQYTTSGLVTAILAWQRKHAPRAR